MTQSEADENNDLFRFGGFALDSARRELRTHGKSVEIEPRAFDVLLYLVRNRDRAVEKDELQDAVWPGVIVTETALSRAVMKARKAVGDDASTQAVIKTLHGHGYRFVAPLLSPDSRTGPAESPVTPSGPEDDPPAASSEAKTDHTFWGSPVIKGLAVLLLVTVSIIAWQAFRAPAQADGESRIAVMPVSDSTGNPEWAWSRLGLMSFVAQSLGGDSELTVVPEASVVGLAENLEWSGNADDPSSQALFDKLRSNFAARHILVMELKSEGPMLRMNYHLLGPGGRSRSGTIVGDQPTELAQGVVQGVYGMVLRKSQVAGEFPLVSEDPFNNEAFARGMSLSLAGRCAEAKQFFKVIVEQEPELFAPRFEYASCLRILGEPEEAELILKQLLEEQAAGGAQRKLAQTLLTLGILYHRTGRLDQAMEKYNEALVVTEQIEDHELRARVLQNLSIGHKGYSELDEAERLLDLAVLAYQDAGRENLPGQLYSGRANLNMARGDFNRAELFLQQALKAFRDIGDRRNEAMMLNNSGYVKWQQGKMDDAENFILQSLAIRQEIGDRVGVGRNYSMLSGVYSAKKNYGEAIKTAGSALEIARESNDRLFEATSLAQMAAAETARGDLAAARLHYLDGRAIFVEIKDYLRVLQSDVNIARLDLDANRLDEAQALAEQVLEQARQQEIMEPEIEAMALIGDIQVAWGDSSTAAREFASALERVRETSWTVMETSLECKLANAYMDLDDLDAVAPLAGSLAAKDPDVEALVTRARFDALRGHKTSAVDLMNQAKTLAGSSWSPENESLLQEYKDA